FMFATGVFVMSTKRNAVGILIGVELILNAANVNLVASSVYTDFNAPFRGFGAPALGGLALRPLRLKALPVDMHHSAGNPCPE
ncbi:MAG: NADH-quinone oxidoreductase subunit K, partial [Planctomycetes bacterium]|nr:NADH-quinone oxidoreductase subunit K [Planctomycetota bacterium]